MSYQYILIRQMCNFVFILRESKYHLVEYSFLKFTTTNIGQDKKILPLHIRFSPTLFYVNLLKVNSFWICFVLFETLFDLIGTQYSNFYKQRYR
ncbi:unnamed protein product (macronuclear) [Paramecium tetraurelia]|uniref:Uncharacterized protein n=1 Tax=Paramecium tetraurelia TaxID=5888 RepID=A0D984_PARTE|nr:uncharacterized protein GSPATT00039342001 [Paramecium tetraurelia]CAK79601.1 unnamed protein product [Paramecium tetraurelia]|eukprot:XP_001446998.1 hypothetical protein (macronuclear) [Paramecium tetraurelia strain d4-2]